MKSLVTPHRPALDQRWYDQLEKLIGITNEIYTVIAPPPERLARDKQSFYQSGHTTNPDLRPVLPDTKPVEDHNARLLELKRSIEQAEQNQVVREAYAARIDELVLTNTMWLAAASDDEDQFEACSTSIYGAPDRAVFAAVADWHRAEAEAAAQSGSLATIKAAQAVLEQVPDRGGDRRLLEPDDNLFGAVKDYHYAPGYYMEQLFDGVQVPETGMITPDIGDPIVRKVLANIGSNFGLADSPGPYWCVLYTQNAIGRPAGYSATPADFTGVISHEVGSHLLERLNGLRQPLRLLGLGLDRYEQGNEGRAILRAQIAYPDFSHYHRSQQWRRFLGYYYAISLGRGFAEVYRVMYAICYLWASFESGDIATSERQAHEEAWMITVRALSGTDGTAGAFHRSLTYVTGNMAWWKAAASDPGVIGQGDMGKFDIANERHMDWLRELKIVD